MSTPITFFRQRQQDAGSTCDFSITDFKDRVYRIFVYSPGSMEKSMVRSRKWMNYDEEFNLLLQKVGPGGIIAQVVETDRGRLFQVTSVSRADANFGTCGVLRPGAELSLEEVKLRKWLATPAGTHLLVPVDQEAEEHLRSLKGYLGWLPSDLESLILYSIRKPSLDARITDLEAKKLAGTGRMGRIREWSIPVLLFGILILNVALFYRTGRPADSSTATATDTSSRLPDAKEPAPAMAAVQRQKVFEILQAVRGKTASFPDFERLYNGHFKRLSTEREVAAALNDAGRAKPLVLGLMKLEALRLDPDAARGLFGGADNPTAVKDFFRDHRLESDSRDMLAALACTAYQAPALPVSRGGASAALPFIQDRDCKSFPLDKATPGLEDLLDFVEHYSSGGGVFGGAG